MEEMKTIRKGLRWRIAYIVSLSVPILRIIYYYVNGQSIASAHLDGHYFAPFINIVTAVFLAIVIIFVSIYKKEKSIMLWFLVPVLFAVCAPLHVYIGGLFLCCPLV